MAPGQLTRRLRLCRADDGNARRRAEGGERSNGRAGEKQVASGNGQINIPVVKEGLIL